MTERNLLKRLTEAITIQKFGFSKIFDAVVFESSILFSPRLHLLDHKYSKNCIVVKCYYN